MSSAFEDLNVLHMLFIIEEVGGSFERASLTSDMVVVLLLADFALTIRFCLFNCDQHLVT